MSTVIEPKPRRVTFNVAIMLSALVMAGVLVFSAWATNQLRSSIAALQDAAPLQSYPDDIAQRLSLLRDRLEARADSGPALAEVRRAVNRFNQRLQALQAGSGKNMPELSEPLSLWTQFSALINPVISFTGEPYDAPAIGGAGFSADGQAHYNAVKQAAFFTAENAKVLKASLSKVVTALQGRIQRTTGSIRWLLIVGAMVPAVLCVMLGLQLWRTGDAQRLHPIVVAALVVIVMLGAGIPALGFSVTTQLDASVAKLQPASELQTYPDEIAQRLSVLRARLEARAYAGQALADLASAVNRFDQRLQDVYAISGRGLPELIELRSLWAQFTALINPVIDFSGQPYATALAGSDTLSRDGQAHYFAVKQAGFFTADNAKVLEGSLNKVGTALQRNAGSSVNLLMMLMTAMIANLLALCVFAGFTGRLSVTSFVSR